ncbi:sodium:solute symporter family protein [Natranaerobius trueperi]|uniref:Sodium:solute symporter n=1 Tax=Natranaerobius trueperi TaxID=759412 RepID=A0A226BWJ1_9FIRM|nr:sodium:solute symporter family protein [Natranaerobius trueperi]OWZ83152.1 sodium:solute symporter [Natranaerobius trueperi]
MEWYYVIPVAYLILLVCIGIYIAKRQETRSDFFVASNRMDGAVLFATIMSTVVGANTYMGFSGDIFETGMSNYWLLFGAGMSYFVLFFISGKIRMIASKYEVFTLPDLVELRYSKPVAIIVTMFSLVGLVGGAGGGILGIGIILNSLFGIDVTTAVLVTAVVTITYTALGGLWGVALTDWFQSIIMIIGVFLILTFGVSAVAPSGAFFTGSFEIVEVFEGNIGGEFIDPLAGMTFALGLAWTITFMPLNTISQTSIQRVYAAENVPQIRKISLLMVIFISLVLTFGLSLIGLLGSGIFTELDNAEAVFPMLSLELLHPVIGMIVVTGIMGAAKSTVDSNFLGSAIHFSRDIYEAYMKTYKNKKIDDKEGLFVSRVAIVVIGVASTLAALWAPGIMDLLVMTQQIFAGATFAPIILGFYWTRANAPGAMTGIILGGGTMFLSNLIEIPLTNEPLIAALLLSIIGVIVGSLLSSEDKENGAVFSFATNITKNDLVLLALTVLVVVIWSLALINPSAWPYLIITTVVLLGASIVFLVYNFIKTRIKAQSTKQKTINQ